MTERLDEHKMKYAVDTDKEAEDICRWAAARAGVIVVAPVVGTMTLMANEVYMITRLAKLRGIKLSESAVLGLLGSLGGALWVADVGNADSLCTGADSRGHVGDLRCGQGGECLAGSRLSGGFVCL